MNEDVHQNDIWLRYLKRKIFSNQIRKPCVGIYWSDEMYQIDFFRPLNKSALQGDESRINPVDELTRLRENEKIKLLYK